MKIEQQEICRCGTFQDALEDALDTIFQRTWPGGDNKCLHYLFVYVGTLTAVANWLYHKKAEEEEENMAEFDACVEQTIEAILKMAMDNKKTIVTGLLERAHEARAAQMAEPASRTEH